MSLKGVHLVFIAASTLMTLSFAAWCVQQYRLTEAAGALAAGIASAGAAVGLAGYGAWFVKVKMGRLP